MINSVVLVSGMQQSDSVIHINCESHSVVSDFCHPMNCTVHGVLQARILEWVAVPFSRGSSQPRDWTQVSCITGRSPSYISYMNVKSLSRVRLFATLWIVTTRLLHPWDFQARILEWVAISFSRGSSWPRDWTHISRIAGRHFTVWATREAPIITVIHIPVSILFKFFSHLDCYMILNRVPCAIYTVGPCWLSILIIACVYVNPKLPNYLH